MWQTRIFKTLEALNKWVEANDHKCQWHQIFVNNAYGVEYRKLRIIG
jgi:hypothetical protein